VVYADQGDIQTGLCTGTKKIADAQREIKQLDELFGGSSS